jgi:hypothetical protein
MKVMKKESKRCHKFSLYSFKKVDANVAELNVLSGGSSALNSNHTLTLYIFVAVKNEGIKKSFILFQ